MARKLEGVELVRRAIKKIRSVGFVEVFGEANVEEIEPLPAPPEVLDRLVLDGGVPLTPCLREWLAFDVRFFDWFVDTKRFALKRQKVGALTAQWLEPGKGSVYRALERSLIPRDCYWIPLGDETMRFVYPSKPDAVGELPVMLADVDDLPALMVGYPGIDVYLGYHAGLLGKDWSNRFADRMAFHEQQVLGGRETIEYGDEPFRERSRKDERTVWQDLAEQLTSLPPGVSPLSGEHFMLQGNGRVPKGFIVERETTNPFTGTRMRVLVRER